MRYHIILIYDSFLSARQIIQTIQAQGIISALGRINRMVYSSVSSCSVRLAGKEAHAMSFLELVSLSLSFIFSFNLALSY